MRVSHSYVWYGSVVPYRGGWRCHPFGVSLFGDPPRSDRYGIYAYVITAIISSVKVCRGLEPQDGRTLLASIPCLLARNEMQRGGPQKGTVVACCGGSGAGDVIEREFPAVLDQLQGCASLL
jgi:hypothetical protein